MFRKIIFWSHLVLGVSAGVIIFIMSATGVVLTYERQILEWQESRFTVVESHGASRLTTDQALSVVRQKHPDEHHFYLRQVNRPGAAIPVWAGRDSYLLHPYTGEILLTGPTTLSGFFRWNENLHRWLLADGSLRPITKNITAYSNLVFLFLIITGLYLWLPKNMRWKVVKQSLLFRRQHNSRRSRYLNWHKVFGVWTLIPLFFIVCTATIFHFPWANKLLYSAYGEVIPAREQHPELEHLEDGKQSYETLFRIAQQHSNLHSQRPWYSMWMEVGETAGEVRFFIDATIGLHPEHAYSLYLDADTGDVVKAKTQADWSKGDRAWDVARYLHTGEYFGLPGQTIAGLASLAACILVFTGFFLSWKRLITPRLKARLT